LTAEDAESTEKNKTIEPHKCKARKGELRSVIARSEGGAAPKSQIRATRQSRLSHLTGGLNGFPPSRKRQKGRSMQRPKYRIQKAVNQRGLRVCHSERSEESLFYLSVLCDQESFKFFVGANLFAISPFCKGGLRRIVLRVHGCAPKTKNNK